MTSTDLIKGMEESLCLMLPEPLTDRRHRRILARKFPTILLDFLSDRKEDEEDSSTDSYNFFESDE